MALNNFKCSHLMPLPFKGLTICSRLISLSWVRNAWLQASARRSESLTDGTLTMPPFNLDTSRRSVSGIIIHTSSPRVAPRAGSASAGRLRSVDSFAEYPSMSDVLLTSSRSSLPTSSDSAAVAAAEEEMVASPATRRSDSARGDSIDSWPSQSDSDPPERSCSLTDVAVAHGGSRGRQVVPDSELQWQAGRRAAGAPVSYTHLTLPTIYSV